MSALKSSYEYARSELERAILNAFQFAHVPHAAIAAELDTHCRTCLVDHEGGTDHVLAGNSDLIRLLREKFGETCQVCLSAVREKGAAEVGTPDGWLFPSLKGPHFALVHQECASIAWTLRRLDSIGYGGREEWEDQDLNVLDHAAFFLKALRRPDSPYREWLRRRKHRDLRFNPREREFEREDFTEMPWKYQDDDVVRRESHSEGILAARERARIAEREVMDRSAAYLFGDDFVQAEVRS